MAVETGAVKKFLDWVNADTGLPPPEEREEGSGSHGGHDEHDSHDAHESHDEFGGFDDLDMGFIGEDEEDEELDNTKMLVDTLQSMSGMAGSARPPARSSRPPSPLLKEGLPRSRSAHVFFRVLSVPLMIGIITGLLITVASMPPFGSPDNPAINEVYARYMEKGVEETGAINIVSGIILEYRAFDTLGETIVLFATVMSIIILIRAASGLQTEQSPGQESDETPQPLILKFVVSMLMPFVAIYGLYILFHGHLSPGGGFSGGAVLGGGISLYANAFGAEKVRRVFSFKTFTYFSCFAILFYTLTKIFSRFAGGFSINVPLGTPGNLLSAGLLLPLNIAVGIIVACIVYGLYALFSEGEV